MATAATAFPLCWPQGWARTSGYQRRSGSPFKGNTFTKARTSLADELERLQAKDIILSTNLPLRLDGQPRAGEPIPADPGVAVYFALKGRPMVMACDRFTHVEDNLRSLALAIDYLRGLERHGGGVMMERAFTGFAALPGPGARASCWDVLGLDRLTLLRSPRDSARLAIHNAHRALARTRHPDAGGTEGAMVELNGARDDALKELCQ